jgi:anhydro-N-acetylmuramic acid kinase
MSYYIGLMSGTSLDAVDAVIVDLKDPSPALIGCHSEPIAEALRGQLLGLFTPGPNEIDRLGPLHRQLGHLYSATVKALLKKTQLLPAEIKAIGNHGQTIRHRPRLAADQAFSLQIGDNHFLAQTTGICVIGDFRARDIAVGGQGAPLVPAFHQAVFGSAHTSRCVLNIGGIANLTYLPKSQDCIGFDTGPGNGLMDAWIKHVQQRPFDQAGLWAASGVVDEDLLANLLAHPYFALSPPKSTGKEEFTLAWLAAVLREYEINKGQAVIAADVQRTLLELTARSIATALENFCPTCDEIYACGGGVLNPLLMERVAAMTKRPVFTTQALGVEPQWVEAMAFAWLAERCLEGLPGNLPSVTGATKPAVLGAIFPAG